jgi:hypothetical protein
VIVPAPFPLRASPHRRLAAGLLRLGIGVGRHGAEQEPEVLGRHLAAGIGRAYERFAAGDLPAARNTPALLLGAQYSQQIVMVCLKAAGISSAGLMREPRGPRVDIIDAEELLAAVEMAGAGAISAR